LIHGVNLCGGFDTLQAHPHPMGWIAILKRVR